MRTIVMGITGRTNSTIRASLKTSVCLILISSGAFGVFSLSAADPEKYPACKAASEKVDYGTALTIPDDTIALIESYRAEWRNLCSFKGGTKPSLSQIFVKAKQIETDFKKVFDAFNESILNETNFDPRRSTAINDLVSNKFPAFVPAFKGAYGEQEIFSPSIDAFRKSAPLGNTEDRIFFEHQLSLEGDFPLYIRKTWDYGGCVLFGEFDWTATLKDIARVKKQVKNTAYLKEAALLEQSLFRELGASYDICTCNKKEAVLKDLLNIQKYLKKEPAYSLHASEVQQKVDSIQSGKITVKSQAEKHCSGG